MYLFDFEYFCLLWRYSPPNFEVVRNRVKFCIFLTPKILLRSAPKILDTHYKIRLRSDHHAKFRADRPTHLGHLAIEINKHLR